jgi:hypothetical protein
MSDITNYAYVWYTRDASSQITEDDLEKIYEIILNYSYPCYLSGSEVIRRLTPEEKTKLLQHELSFIEEKMEMAGLSHIIMMQIPRVLYDLFNIYFTFKHTKTDMSTIPNFYYPCSVNIAKMIDYNALTREFTDYVKNNIFALNAFIVKYIQEKYSISTIRDSYDKMADELLAECWLIRDIPAASPSMTPEQTEALKEPNLPDQPPMIPEQMESAFIPSLIKLIKRMSLEEAKNIVRQTIHFEKQDSQGHAVLYRGSQNDMDSLIDVSENYRSNPPWCDKYMGEVMSRYPCLSISFRSLSFNLSIFTGCVMDFGACTMAYLSLISSRMKVNDKIKFNIKKFFLDDSSSENSLFFIPPIHPYVQLYSSGELFHPRTKIGIDYTDKFKIFKDTTPKSRFFSVEIVKGLFECRPNEKTFVEECDYLKSKETHEQLNALYQRYKSTSVIGTWSSDAATQSKQEQFMETRTANVKEVASTSLEKFKGLNKSEIGNQWKKLEAIPGEMKFKAIDDYYPDLVSRFRFMISNFISEYLYSICPQASVKVSYQSNQERGYYRNVSYPSATFEFETKGDFEKCQSDLPTSMLTFEKKSLISTRRSHPPSSPPHKPSATTLASAATFNSSSFHSETLHSGKVERLFESAKFTLPRGSELSKEREKIVEIIHMIMDIGYFLSNYTFRKPRRDNDTEYKDNLNNYFKFIRDMFPKLLQGQGPFPSPTKPVQEMPVAPVPVSPVGPVPERPAKKTILTFAEKAFKEMAKDGDEYGGGKKRTIRKKNRKGTRTTIRKRQRKNRTRIMRKKSRKFGER